MVDFQKEASDIGILIGRSHSNNGILIGPHIFVVLYRGPSHPHVISAHSIINITIWPSPKSLALGRSMRPSFLKDQN